MRAALIAAVVLMCAACGGDTSPYSGGYLFAWTGDSARTSSDFLAVIDALPSSPTYGTVVASLPTGAIATHPHHTEAELGDNAHLLANGFHAGRTWLYDLSTPREPKIMTSFGDVAGFSHPHSFARLANGNVLATFQYAADSSAPPMADHGTMSTAVVHATGGLVEMDERGTMIKSRSAADAAIPDRRIYPYSVLPIAALDRAVSTTTDMDEADSVATSEWVQFWRLSDLTLLRSVALKAGPRGDEQRYTGEPRLLPDGRSVYIHTFNCGLYLVRGVDSAQPTSTFVKGFQGKNCGVPLLIGHYWLQTIPEAHSLMALDIADAEHPREVSTLKFADDEQPHWISADRAAKRVVLNSAGGKGNRLYIVNFDSITGALTLDERFRDPGASRPGVSFTQKKWPHGFTGTAYPHGTVFSR
jgi:hypothetical protein